MPRAGFLRVRLRAVPVALTLLTVLLMAGTGHYIVNRFRATLLHTYAEIAEVYVNQFLEPYATAYVSSSAAESPRLLEIEAALTRQLATRPDLVVQIWLPDGRLVYSSAGPTDASGHDNAGLSDAIDGRSVAHIETAEDGEGGGPLPLPYLEIYLPILDPALGHPIAVGELYVDARAILADARLFEQTVWLAIGTAMLAVIGMLALSARQSEELRARLVTEQSLVGSNKALRQDAEQARLDASQANEQLLNFVGAEIHDGPVQLLGLASLMGADMPASAPRSTSTPIALVQQAMVELRRISAGLILPELADLDLRQVVALAVSRHRALTGAAVDLDLGPATSPPWLDLPRRICIYRVVQEGLTNATRHGDDGRVQVSVTGDRGALTVRIESHHAAPTEAAPDAVGQGLGLQGMRRRLEAFGGTATLDASGDRSALLVRLPLPEIAPGGPAATGQTRDPDPAPDPTRDPTAPRYPST